MRTRGGFFIERSAVFLLFALLFALITGFEKDSLPFSITSADISQVYWNTNHFSNQILAGKNPYATEQMFAPFGSTLYFHSYTAIFGLCNLIIRNPVIAINLVLLLNFAFAGLGFYILAGNWIQSVFFKFSAAFLAVFNSYLLHKTGIHYNLILIAFVPWNILLLMRAVNPERPGILSMRDLILFLLLLPVNYLMDYYALFYVLFFSVLYIFYGWFFKKWVSNMTVKKTIGLLLFVLVAHLLSRYLFLHGFDSKGGIWESADFRQFFMPPEDGRFFSWHASYKPLTENFVFAGFCILIFTLISVVITVRKKEYRHQYGFLVFALLSAVLVMFPDFRIGPEHVFFTPSSLLHYIPFANNLRSPSRFAEMYAVFAGIVLMGTTERLLTGFKPVFQMAVSVLLMLLIYVEFAVQPYERLTAKELRIPENEKKLFQNKTVLTIPFGIIDGLKGMGVFAESDYKLASEPGIRLVSGYISRIPEQTWRHYESDPFYREITEGQGTGNFDIPQLYQKLKSHHIDAIRVDISLGDQRLQAVCTTLDKMVDKGELNRIIRTNQRNLFIYLVR